jgi:hypothetical protein
MEQWLDVVEHVDGQGLSLRATVTPRGMFSYDLRALFGPIQADGNGGGVIEAAIPRSEVEWYASRLLAVGPDVVVQSPPELIVAIRAQVAALARLYRRSKPDSDASLEAQCDSVQTHDCPGASTPVPSPTAPSA